MAGKNWRSRRLQAPSSSPARNRRSRCSRRSARPPTLAGMAITPGSQRWRAPCAWAASRPSSTNACSAGRSRPTRNLASYLVADTATGTKHDHQVFHRASLRSDQRPACAATGGPGRSGHRPGDHDSTIVAGPIRRGGRAARRGGETRHAQMLSRSCPARTPEPGHHHRRRQEDHGRQLDPQRRADHRGRRPVRRVLGDAGATCRSTCCTPRWPAPTGRCHRGQGRRRRPAGGHARARQHPRDRRPLDPPRPPTSDNFTGASPLGLFAPPTPTSPTVKIRHSNHTGLNTGQHQAKTVANDNTT